MTQVSFDARGFSVSKKRVHMVAGRIEYSLLERSSWRSRLQSLKAAGFNSIVTSAPWAFHEARRGRFGFEGEHDLREFLDLAGEIGLWVVLRVGPNVGAPFGCGGLPAWLGDVRNTDGSELLLRESDPGFMQAVTHWWSALFSRIEGMQPDPEQGDGPDAGCLLAIQVEHEWTCGNVEGARAYFDELTHIIRESGITIPLLTSNGFWPETDGLIETWSDTVGGDSIFANTRQLHVVKPEHPRIVSIRGGADHPERLADSILQVLAAGGMPLVDDAVAGMHRRTLASRSDGSGIVKGSILDLSGNRVGSSSAALSVIRFARSFGSMLSELDPELDSPALEPGSTPCSIVSRTGSAGGAVYLLGSPDSGSLETRVILRNGRTLEASFQDPGSWCLVDVNLDGMGHLDRSNIPIFDLVDRRILVGFGVPGSTAVIEIDGAELRIQVPDRGSDMPEIVEFKNFLVVLCTPEQASTVVDDGKSLYIGASGLDADGAPAADPSGNGLVRIDPDGSVESIEVPAPRRAGSQSMDLEWSTAPLDDDMDGSSDRFATLKSPSSLHECGVQQGCGWYRVSIDSTQSIKRSLHFPEGSHRLVMFLDGKRKADLDSGNIGSNVVDIKFTPGRSMMTVLAELNGGPEQGNQQVLRSGLHHPVEVLERLKDVRSSRKSDVAPIDVFQGRAFIPEAVSGDRSSTLAFNWTFTHRKKSSLRVLPNMHLKGTWILNGETLRRSEPGGPQSFALNASKIESMKAGRNELVFRPDCDFEDAVDSLRSSLKIHEVVDTLGDDEGTLAFSTCPIPDGLIHEFQPVSGTRRRKSTAGPSWSRAQFSRSGRIDSATIDFSNMSRGFAFVDGSEVGSYDSSGVAKIPLPGNISSESVIDIFDEQGVDPRSILLVPGTSRD